MRGEFWQMGAVAVGLLAGLGFSIPMAHGDATARTISPNEIKEGMKGYGLTVFKGTEPERFDVEVIGVLHNFRPGQDLILINTPNPRLNVTKNVQGMSGSPIYLDGGRLAGAYAYSLRQFQIEPVAGVTPIETMLTELHRPIVPGLFGNAPLPSAHVASAHGTMAHHDNGTTLFDGEPGAYDLEKHAAQIEARLGGRDDAARAFVPSATPLLMSGFGDRSAAYMRHLLEPLGLEPLQAGGGQSNDKSGPAHYVDGGSVGIALVRGDISAMGTGTVTYVEGSKLCGFGHPMLGGGDSLLPASLARVLWIYASEQHSFKVAEALRPLGALVQDRQSSIVVDETKTAPMFPMDVDIKGAVGTEKKNWHVEIAEDRFMTPSFVASTIGSAIEGTIGERRDMTWQVRSKITIEGHGTIEVEDFGVSSGGMPDASDFARSHVTHVVGDAMNNPWQYVHIAKVESQMTVQYARDVWRIRGVELTADTVDVGQSAHVIVHLLPNDGPEHVQTLDVKMPPELAGKDVEIEILPGYEVTPDLAAPDTLDELLANESRDTATPRSLVAQYKLPSQGLAYRGHVARDLPSFAVEELRPIHSDNGPEAFVTYTRSITPIDRYVEGRDKVRVHVRPVVR